MDEGFESPEEAVLQSYKFVTEEENGENSMRIYYPDFSDMHDEKFKFWNFLNEDEFSADFLPFNNQQQRSFLENSVETIGLKYTAEEEKLLPLDENKSLADSGIFWDFLSTNEEELDRQSKYSSSKKIEPLSDSSLFYDVTDIAAQHIDESGCRRESEFWDFINTSDSSELYNVESKKLNPPETFSSTSLHQTIEMSTEKRNKSKNLDADNFWDFLNSNNSPNIDYKDVFCDVISPTKRLATETPLMQPLNEIKKINKTQMDENFTNEKAIQLPCISSVFSLKSFPFKDFKELSKSKCQYDNPLYTHIQEVNTMKERCYSTCLKKSSSKCQPSEEPPVTKKQETQQKTLSNETKNSKICNDVQVINGYETLPFGINKKQDEQFCLVLPDSDTLRDPNYSHFFVVLNVPPQQNNSTQNAAHLAAKKIHQEDNLGTQEKSNVTESNEEIERNKFLAGFRNKYILDLNNSKRKNESSLSLNTSKEARDKCEMPLFSETPNEENFNKMIAYVNVQPQHVNKPRIELPNISRPLKQTKPIKRISLGKHKNAIQQIDTPVKLDDFIAVNNRPAKEQIILKNTNLIDIKRNELKIQSVKNCENVLTKYAATSNSNLGNLVKKNYSNFLQINEKPVSSNSNSIKIATLGQSFPCSNTIILQNQLTFKTVNNPQVQVPTSTDSVQGLFQIPVNMMPVQVLPHTSSQPVSSKTLSLQSSIPMKKVPIPRKDIEISKRTKGRRKTVKELLQERQRSSDPRKSLANKREIKVLRPICKIPVGPDTQQKALTNIQTAGRDGTKRPNIMILPSASKLNNASEIQNRKKSFILNISHSDITLSPFCKSGEKGKNSRPRYYDLSELQIGYFKVEDDVDSCGRFRSKFKVIFTKCQFLYDFPVSNCNQPELKKAELSEQFARITIPFKSIISMSMRDRIIYICLNDTPEMSLGMITSRSRKFSNVYDTDIESTWRDFLTSTLTHKVVLRKRQAGKLKISLCQFDKRFISLTNISMYGNLARDDSDPYVYGNEMSPRFDQANAAKNKKSCIRRLPQWDSNSEEKSEDLLMNQVCSCRTNCRYIRCSCVKAAKSCSFSGSMCQCINCNNPLNVLETIGMDIEFSIQDSCLFQNIYQIPELLSYLQREVRLECCKSFARVQDCIPGTVLCPNIDCNARLEFSWCHRIVCYPEHNPRNHCSFCGQCRFSKKYHCSTCKRCYLVTTKSISCPRCQKEEVVNTVTSESKKQTLKPEIIVLQSSIHNSKETPATVKSSSTIINPPKIC